MSPRNLRPVLTQHDIETAIVDLGDRLESIVDDFADIAERHYVAESDFKREAAMMTLAVIEHPPKDADGKPRKITAAERDAIVELQINAKRREAAIAAAAREAAREALNTHRTRLESYRTLAANVRYLTAPDR